MDKWIKLIYIYMIFAFACNIVCKSTTKRTKISRITSKSFNGTNRISEFQTIAATNSSTEKTRNNKRTATIAILKGALQTELKMEKNLKILMDDLILNMNRSTVKENVKKVDKIQKTIARDKKAILILVNALEISRNNSNGTFEEYQKELKRIVHTKPDSTEDQTFEFDPTLDLSDQMLDLKTEIEHHLHQMKNDLKRSSRKTIRYLKTETKEATAKIDKKVAEPAPEETLPPENEIVYHSFIPFPEIPLLPYVDFGNDLDLFSQLRRQDEDDESEEKKLKKDENDEKKKENQEVTVEKDGDSDEFQDDEDAAPGGLAGLIANLSGGENGSDVGALIAALSQVLTNVFGPGGLDIPGLLASGTSLLAGLLAGDENFGKVLGEYVGTAIDGLSGGGGADNNGQFFGYLIGTVLAQLSSDPEDDELPPKPKIFIENFFTGFGKAQRKDGYAEGGDGGDKGQKTGGSADFFGFITKIVSSVVGGITSFILNASLGSSAGSSAGSAEFSAGSSGSSSGDHPHPTNKPSDAY